MQQPEPVTPQSVNLPATVTSKPGLWGPWATFGLSVAIFLVNGLFQTIIVVFFAVLLATDGYSFSDAAGIQQFLQDLMADGRMLSLAIAVSAIAGIAVTVLFIKIRRVLSVTEYLELKAIGPKSVLMVLGVFVAAVALSVAVSLLFKTQGDDIFSNAYRNTPWPVFFWLAVVVIGPVYEEVLFRGFLFAGLQQSRLGIAGTIVVTGLAFALLHSAQYESAIIAQIYVLGILLGLVRWKTGSLWSSILLHAVWNLMQMIIMTFFPALST